MTYYVIGKYGARFGPVDTATLGEWVREGRIVANTLLMEAESEQTFPASAVLDFSRPAAVAERYLTTSRGADRFVGGIVGLAVGILCLLLSAWMLRYSWWLPVVAVGVVEAGIYVVMRDTYPQFAAGAAFGGVGCMAVALGALAVCFAALSRLMG